MDKIDEAFNKNISQSLQRILGNTGTKVLYLNLVSQGVTNGDVSTNPNALADGLEVILGPSGARLLIKLIASDLVNEFKLTRGSKESTIAEILKELRRKGFTESF